MSLQSIGQNGAEEFFETILYGVAYTEAQDQIKNFTKDIEDPITQDALSSMMSVVTAGVIFLLIRKQESFIQGVFDVAKDLVVLILASEIGQKMKGKLAGLKGFKLLKKIDLFRASFADRVAAANLVVNAAGSHFSAERTAQSDTSMLDSVMKTKDHIVEKEKLNHSVGNSMASRYNETLMFKLFTKSFTSNDETLIKKMLGRDAASQLKIEDMNKVADFMFVTDTNGNITGLTEQMFQLINGLGYLHNK